MQSASGLCSFILPSPGRRLHLPSRGFVFFAWFPFCRGITSIRNAMPRCLNKKEINMNTKVLLLGAVVTAFTFTTFATDALLSPRAQGNETKAVGSSVPALAITVAYVGPTASALLSPRAQANQIKVIQGVANDQNPALGCRNSMVNSPKSVMECASHATMPGCMKLAAM